MKIVVTCVEHSRVVGGVPTLERAIGQIDEGVWVVDTSDMYCAGNDTTNCHFTWSVDVLS